MAGYLNAPGNKTTDRTGANASRKLKAAGFNVSPAARRYSHDGLFVTGRQGRVSVLVSLGQGAQGNLKAAADIAALARTWGVKDLAVTVDEDTATAWVRYTV
jgi:hypothetical protein